MIFSSGFWYDSRLRCDVADLYFKLYGRKRPQSLPIPELAMLRQPMVNQTKPEKTKQEKFTIPKAEKRKILPDQEPEGKPVQFSGTVEARTVSKRLYKNSSLLYNYNFNIIEHCTPRDCWPIIDR